jgi:threonine synthase
MNDALSFHDAVRPTPAYIAPLTGATHLLDQPRWRSDTGGALMITPLPGIGRQDIDLSRRSLWRYAAALPLTVSNPVSMRMAER